MKLLGLIAGKSPSLEEGAMTYPYPEAIIKTRVAPRNHFERCIQMLKVILYFELILLIGWIGILFLSNYYANPLSNGVGMQQKDSNWMYDGDGVNSGEFNSDDVPSTGGPSTENYSSSKVHRFLTMDGDELIESIEQSQSTTESNMDDSHNFMKFEPSETPNSDEEKTSDIDVMLLKLLEVMTSKITTNVDTLSDNNDWEEGLKNGDTGMEEKVIIIGNIDHEEPSETTTEPNMDDGDEDIAIEKSELPIIRATQAADGIMSLSEWLDMMSMKDKMIDEYLDDSDEWDDRNERSKDVDTPDEEKTIVGSNIFDEAEQDTSFDDRFKRLMAKIDEDIEKHYSEKNKFEMSPIFDDDDSSDVIPDEPVELPSLHRLLFHTILPHSFPSSVELDAESSDDYGKLEWYKNPQDDKDDLFSRLAREIGTKVDSDSNSSSDETTTTAPKVKRSAESSSEESSESNEKWQIPDSLLNNDAVAEILNNVLTKYPKDLDKNNTPQSIKDFEDAMNRLKELASEITKRNSTDTLASETVRLDDGNKDKTI